MLLHGSISRADFVSFTTIGTFTGGNTSNTSTFTLPGISIVFQSPILGNSVNVPPTSVATFGTFDTHLTTAPVLTPVTAGFRLDIFQSSPTFGSAFFVGSLSGSLRIDNSQASIQFAAPLTATNATLGNVFYRITSADDGVTGRVVLSAPNSNGGLSTIAGQIGIVPEPASFVLMAIGCPVVLGCAYRSRRKLLAAA